MLCVSAPCYTMQAAVSASMATSGGSAFRQQQRCAPQGCPRALPALCRPLRADNMCSSKLARRAGRLHALRTGCEGLPRLDRAALPPPPPAVPSSPSLLQRLARAGGAVALGAALALGSAGAAEAARSGGRMGGSSFGRSSFSGGRSGFGAAASSGGSSRFGSSFGSSLGSSSFGSSFGSSFRSSFGSSSSGSGYRSSYSGGAITGGFSSSTPSTSGGVRVNSFFLSPWGEGLLCQHVAYRRAPIRGLAACRLVRLRCARGGVSCSEALRCGAACGAAARMPPMHAVRAA